MVDSAGDYGTLSYLSTTKYSNDGTISTVSFIVMRALWLRTSVDDTLLWGDLLLQGHRLCNSHVGTAVLYNLCGSAAVAKLQLPSSQPVQA